VYGYTMPLAAQLSPVRKSQKAKLDPAYLATRGKQKKGGFRRDFNGLT